MVKVEGRSEKDLLFLLARDTDSFSKWEASQSLQRSLLLKLYNAAKQASGVLSSTFSPPFYRRTQTYVHVVISRLQAMQCHQARNDTKHAFPNCAPCWAA